MITLQKKEYIENRINTLDTKLTQSIYDVSKHYCYIANQSNEVIHIVIPYDRMLYDKGFLRVTGTMNGEANDCIVSYTRTTGTLSMIIGNRVSMISIGAEESRLVRIILLITGFSVYKIECCDYFEYAIM